MAKILRERNRLNQIKGHLEKKYSRKFDSKEITKIVSGKDPQFQEDKQAISEFQGKSYSPQVVKQIIQRYENISSGLLDDSLSEKTGTQAFFNKLRSQRESSFDALKLITGEELDSSSLHLGEINLQEVLSIESSAIEGVYDEKQFISYTTQRFLDLFETERIRIDTELEKFESVSGKKREVLYGYITKNVESANARMVGGVCVCGDNPDKFPDQNIWEMENYLQMVFQEPDTQQCQGLILAHHFNEDGEKILTYVYSVDEAALCEGILGAMENFAVDNEFDKIVISQNRAIRTNRTGGEFENSLNRRVAKIGKTFKFKDVKQFSFHPNYTIQEMDVVWERTK